VGHPRVASAHHPGDPELRALIAGPLAGSPGLAAARNSRRPRAGHRAEAAFRPPGGEVEGEPDLAVLDVLAVPERGRRLVLLTARPGCDAYRALRGLVAGAAPEAAAPEARPVGTA
jgi:hypothetical protein